MTSKVTESLEAEQAVLGAALLDREALEDAASILKPGMFLRPSHEAIFRAALQVAQAGQPVDVLSVQYRLRDDGKLATAGGLAYLTDLAQGVPTTANARSYAGIVREAWIRRAAAGIGDQIRALAEDASVGVAELTSRAEAAIVALGQHQDPNAMVALSEAVSGRLADLRAGLEHPGPRGVLTGFRDFDAMTGGLRGMTILAARPGHGKTQFALQASLRFAKQAKTPVAFFSLEMDPGELAVRAMSLWSNASSQRIDQGFVSPEELDRMGLMLNAPEVAEVLVDPTSNATTTDLLARARRLKSRRGLGLVVLDYLQLVGDKADRTIGSRNDLLAAMTRRLKLASRELGVPFLVLSQMSREIEKRADHRPHLADLRDSGAIEQDADMVVFVTNPDKFGDPNREGQADLWIEKNRHGKTGRVTLAWVDKLGKFADLERHHA